MTALKKIILPIAFILTLQVSAQTETAVPEQTTTATETPSALPPDSTQNTGAVTPATGGTEPVPTTETTEVVSSPSDNPPVNTLQSMAWKKANMLYNAKAYAEAIPYFEKIYQADSTNEMLLEKLGDCYRLTNNTQGQLLCYGGLINLGAAKPIQELYYGQALVENGEAEKAKPYFEKYNNDNRGKNLSASYAQAATYKRNADAYALTPVPYNSDQNDMCAIKYYNAIVFASTRTKTEWINKQQGWTNGNYLHIYATEKDVTGNYTTPKTFMKDLDSKYNDGPMCFNKDFSLLYFTRNTIKAKANDGTNKLEILEAELDENGLSRVNLLPFNSKDHNCAHPAISPDGYTLYFASDMEGGKGGMDIYMCKKDSSGVWGTPVNLGDKVNTAGTEVFPYVAPNGVLYFSSNGHDGLGGLDIYEVKIKDGVVAKIYNMGEPVNSNKDDFGMFLNEDCKSGFISSNRKAGGMDDDIYELTILREVRRGKEVLIVTKDKLSGEPIPGVKIAINADTVITNERGEYQTMADEEAEYTLVATKTDYFSAEDNMSAKSSLEDSFTKEIFLEKDPKLFLRALITDTKSGEPLEGVTIKVTDIATNSDLDVFTTTPDGDYFKFLFSNRIGDKLTYLIRLEKKGYLQRTVVFTHTIEKPGEINLNESLNLSLGKVEVGMDLAKMIDLKPIYFDVGKSTIRKDAALELDKIVQIMNEYPNMYIELGSHTDCRSSAASNLKLSTARAKASAAYIVQKGINKMRIVGKGYGESKLLNNCACEGKVESKCSEEEHEKNRRTEFVITKLQ